MNRIELITKAYESFKGLQVFPYHNFIHCVETANRVLSASFYYGLPEDKRTALYNAALFHDASYVGAADDAINVAAAVKAWGEGGLVEELILSTKGPWQSPSQHDPHALLKNIIRDADILQSAELSWKLLLQEEAAVDATDEWLLDHLTTDWGKAFFRMKVESSLHL